MNERMRARLRVVRRVSLIVVAVLAGGAAAFYAFARFAFADGCDVDMTTPDRFLLEHDVVGRGVVVERRVMADLGAAGIYRWSIANLEVVRHTVRTIEALAGDPAPTLRLWMLRTRIDDGKPDRQRAWAIGDTVVFCGEHPNGATDNLRLMEWWDDEQVAAFADGPYSREWEHWAPQDSLIAARLRGVLPQQAIGTRAGDRATVIVRSERDLLDLNGSATLCLPLDGGILRSERVTPLEYVERLRRRAGEDGDG